MSHASVYKVTAMFTKSTYTDTAKAVYVED